MAVGNAMVNTARFKPLSYDEWAAPLKEVSSKHDSMLEALMTLDEEGSAYQAYINSLPKDSNIRSQYENYLNNIQGQTDTLLSNGIQGTNTVNNLINLRRLYNKSIRPVKTAVTTLGLIENERAKAKGRIIGAPDIDLQYLLEHPEYTVADDKKSWIMLDDAAKKAANLFKGATKFDTTPVLVKQQGDLGYFAQRQGYLGEELRAAILGDNNVPIPEELTNIMNIAKADVNFDALSPYEQQMYLNAVLSEVSKNAKPIKEYTRNLPKGKTVANDGTVVSKYKDKEYVGTDSDGRDIYKNKTGTQFYYEGSMSDGREGLFPVTKDFSIDDKNYTVTKPGSIKEQEPKKRYLGIYSADGIQIDNTNGYTLTTKSSELQEKFRGVTVGQFAESLAKQHKVKNQIPSYEVFVLKDKKGNIEDIRIRLNNPEYTESATSEKKTSSKRKAGK